MKDKPESVSANFRRLVFTRRPGDVIELWYGGELIGLVETIDRRVQVAVHAAPSLHLVRGEALNRGDKPPCT